MENKTDSEIAKEIFAPVPLNKSHQVNNFSSGESQLDDWLKRKALKNQQTGATRTYVVCQNDRQNDQVIGYYALAVGSIAHASAVGKIKRNMPNPVPVMILARLAVHLDWQGKGLGASLLGDAVRRTFQASEIAGIRAILVHAISEPAKRFYQYFGFQASSVDSMTLMARLVDFPL